MPYSFRHEGNRVALVRKSDGKVVGHFKSEADAKRAAGIREWFAKKKSGKK